MRIGIVLSQPPSYSETFFNSKIKGLLAQGFVVEMYVRQKNSAYDVCKVKGAPKLQKIRVLQACWAILVYISLVPYLSRVLSFIRLEKSVGRSGIQIAKHIFINSHLLKAKVDWLYYGFATMALRSEHVCKSIGAKMAVSCRGYDVDVYPLKHPHCYDLLWQNVDKVHVISQYVLSQALKQGMRTKTPVNIIYPATNTRVKVIREKSEGFKTPIKILTVARLHWIKGLNSILESLATLKTKGIRFNYEVIGEGKAYESLKYTTHHLNLGDCVTFVGKIPHNEVIEKLKYADIYIQYSYSEGFCNAVLEAQLMHCICVVSNAGGLPENVINNKTGFVVPSRMPKLLAQKLVDICNENQSVLNEIKRNAYDRVLSEFNIEDQIKQFIDFYKY